MTFKGPLTEFIFGSVPASLVSDIALPTDLSALREPIGAALVDSYFQLLYALVQDAPPKADAFAFRHAIGDVFRSLVRLASQGDGLQPSLFERAISALRLNLSNPALNAEYLAPDLGVSSRQLQLEFQRQGSTIQRELRRLRAAAAMQTKRENPDVDMLTLAQVFGFGSQSTLYRALAEEAQLVELNQRAVTPEKETDDV